MIHIITVLTILNDIFIYHIYLFIMTIDVHSHHRCITQFDSYFNSTISFVNVQ